MIIRKTIALLVVLAISAGALAACDYIPRNTPQHSIPRNNFPQDIIPEEIGGIKAYLIGGLYGNDGNSVFISSIDELQHCAGKLL
ncbi:MAG: hypothetical protein FWD30_03925 [Dehalococcoidia bacterium]|nr:hypothetical protein [Dehalococcoidia bacterium]